MTAEEWVKRSIYDHYALLYPDCKCSVGIKRYTTTEEFIDVYYWTDCTPWATPNSVERDSATGEVRILNRFCTMHCIFMLRTVCSYWWYVKVDCEGPYCPFITRQWRITAGEEDCDEVFLLEMTRLYRQSCDIVTTRCRSSFFSEDRKEVVDPPTPEDAVAADVVTQFLSEHPVLRQRVKLGKRIKVPVRIDPQRESPFAKPKIGNFPR
jgi:hypothetical protein